MYLPEAAKAKQRMKILIFSAGVQPPVLFKQSLD
jgi:hypothetical protein